MNTEIETFVRLKLSVQRALLGHVTGQMAAVLAQISDTQRIVLEFFFFGEVHEGDRQIAEEITAEVIADFSEDYSIQTECERLTDMGERAASQFMFLRAEAFAPPPQLLVDNLQ
jgi:hypothetical protein